MVREGQASFAERGLAPGFCRFTKLMGFTVHINDLEVRPFQQASSFRHEERIKCTIMGQ